MQDDIESVRERIKQANERNWYSSDLMRREIELRVALRARYGTDDPLLRACVRLLQQRKASRRSFLSCRWLNR